MANVFNVARYILRKTGRVSSWKLQKLCYYSQAWAVTWTERPLFRNRIEAWRNGPVCPDFFNIHQGKFYVDLNDVPDYLEDKQNPLTDDEEDTINQVLDHYQHMEPYELRELTHSEAPWQNARKGVPEGSTSHNEITVESMGDYYSGL